MNLKDLIGGLVSDFGRVKRTAERAVRQAEAAGLIKSYWNPTWRKEKLVEVVE